MLGTYRDNRFLSLNGGSQLLLLDLDNQVLALVVAWDLERDVDIFDGLCPLVWESVLLCLFLRGGCSFNGRVWVVLVVY